LKRLHGKFGDFSMVASLINGPNPGSIEARFTTPFQAIFGDICGEIVEFEAIKRRNSM